MTARLFESTVGVRRSRVLSVSPMTAQVVSLGAQRVTSGVVVPPRSDVAEHSDFTHLVDQAREVTATLLSAIDQASRTDSQVHHAMQQLQDRLRVGARMLQAFQTQISRIEACVDDAQRRPWMKELDDQVAAIEQRIESAIDAFEQRLSAIERYR